METIIVDDGSQPPFQLPADLAGTRNVRVVRHDRNRGPAAARNTGVKTARDAVPLGTLAQSRSLP